MADKIMLYDEFDNYKYKKETCDTLNSFDIERSGKTPEEVHQQKLNYAANLDGDERRWAYAWIRYQ